jgi:hypothetical protein
MHLLCHCTIPKTKKRNIAHAGNAKMRCGENLLASCVYCRHWLDTSESVMVKDCTLYAETQGLVLPESERSEDQQKILIALPTLCQRAAARKRWIDRLETYWTRHVNFGTGNRTDVPFISIHPLTETTTQYDTYVRTYGREQRKISPCNTPHHVQYYASYVLWRQ